MIHEIWSSGALLGSQKLIKIIDMEASIQTVVVDGKSVVVVHLIGRTETESVALFRQACQQVLPGKSVLFNFQKLSFVGSMGLRSFLEALHSLAQSTNTDVRFCGVSQDFLMVLAATPLRFRPILPDVDSALVGFAYPAPVIETPPSEASHTEYISLTEEMVEESSGQGDGDLSVGG